jgi:hypothetical protein
MIASDNELKKIGTADKYDKRLKALGVTNKEQRNVLISFMNQLVTIAYGIMEERQFEITELNNKSNYEEK